MANLVIVQFDRSVRAIHELAHYPLFAAEAIVAQPAVFIYWIVSMQVDSKAANGRNWRVINEKRVPDESGTLCFLM